MVKVDRAIADDGRIEIGAGLALVRTALMGVIAPLAVKDDSGVELALRLWLSSWDDAGRSFREMFEFVWLKADHQFRVGKPVIVLRWFTTAITQEAALRASWPPVGARAVEQQRMSFAHAEQSVCTSPAPVEQATHDLLPDEVAFDPEAPIGSELWRQKMLWASGTIAVRICSAFVDGSRAPPDMCDTEMLTITLAIMSHGILSDNEPTEDVIEMVKLAASRHDPVVIFGVLAQSLLVRFDAGDHSADWSNVTSSIALVLARARDEDLVVVAKPESVVMDELHQGGADAVSASPSLKSQEAPRERHSI